jgi:hypothetical protein
MKKATKSYQNEPVGPMKSSTMKKATKSYQNEPVKPTVGYEGCMMKFITKNARKKKEFLTKKTKPKHEKLNEMNVEITNDIAARTIYFNGKRAKRYIAARTTNFNGK